MLMGSGTQERFLEHCIHSPSLRVANEATEVTGVNQKRHQNTLIRLLCQLLGADTYSPITHKTEEGLQGWFCLLTNKNNDIQIFTATTIRVLYCSTSNPPSALAYIAGFI